MTQYGAILCDPPWSFKTYSAKGRGRSPDNHYPCMDLDDMKRLSVPHGESCALFMWVVDAHLIEAIDLISAWGFKFKTVAFIWDKGKMGLGYWSRKEAEICLLATCGKPKRLHCDVRQIIRAPRREHSRKPDEIYDRIERLVGGPYLEIFSRTDRPGWDAIGNQTGMFK